MGAEHLRWKDNASSTEVVGWMASLRAASEACYQTQLDQYLMAWWHPLQLLQLQSTPFTQKAQPHSWLLTGLCVLALAVCLPAGPRSGRACRGLGFLFAGTSCSASGLPLCGFGRIRLLVRRKVTLFHTCNGRRVLGPRWLL